MNYSQNLNGRKMDAICHDVGRTWNHEFTGSTASSETTDLGKSAEVLRRVEDDP
jgi:hypothetical protein